MQTLQLLRRSRGLTIIDLALLSGVPARTLGAIECGLQQFDHATRTTLACIFGVAPEYLQPAPPPALQVALRTQALAQARSVAPAVVLGIASAALLAPLLPSPSATQPVQLPAPAQRIGASQPQRLMPVVGLSPQHRTTPEELRRLLAQLAMPDDPPHHAVVPLTQHVSAAGQGWSVPRGCPLVPGNGMIVITQEYGVGTHAPAAIWGGIDLAVDSDGDGFAEPAATSGVPVLATHDGVALVRPGTWPAGNYVRIINEEAGWSSAYAHLGAIDVRDGQRVRAGDLIGIIGSTGQASGPHLHYEIWRDGENIDPLPFVACTMASPSHHRLLAPAR